MWNIDELNSNPYYGRDEYEESFYNPYDYDIDHIPGGGYTEPKQPKKNKKK